MIKTLTPKGILIIFSSCCIPFAGCDNNQLSREKAKILIEDALSADKNQSEITLLQGDIIEYPLVRDYFNLEFYEQLQKHAFLSVHHLSNDRWGHGLFHIALNNTIKPFVIREASFDQEGSLLHDEFHYPTTVVKGWTRIIDRVTGINLNPATVQQCSALVEFVYAYQISPIGEIADAHLSKYPLGGGIIGYENKKPAGGTACFSLYDDGWRVIRVDNSDHALASPPKSSDIKSKSQRYNPPENTPAQRQTEITLLNQNCWPQDFYINGQRVATIPQKTSHILHVKPGTYVTKACTTGTSNCGDASSVTWAEGRTTHTLFPHPSCSK